MCEWNVSSESRGLTTIANRADRDHAERMQEHIARVIRSGTSGDVILVEKDAKSLAPLRAAPRFPRRATRWGRRHGCCRHHRRHERTLSIFLRRTIFEEREVVSLEIRDAGPPDSRVGVTLTGLDAGRDAVIEIRDRPTPSAERRRCAE